MDRYSEWIVLLLCLGLALWTGLAENIHAHHQGDSLVPALMSLERWTFFYWGQNRYGALVPLLTVPFDHPVHVLVAQHLLSSFLGLLAFFAVARVALGRGLGWVIAGALGATLFLATQSDGSRFVYLSILQPAGASLALGACGLAIWLEAPQPRPNRARVVTGAVLIWLALWVNMAAFFFVATVLLAERVLDRRTPARAWYGELATLLSFAVLYVIMELYPYGSDYDLLPPSAWPGHTVEFARVVWRDLLNQGHAHGLGVLLLLSGLALIRGPALRWPAAAAIALGALAYLALFAVLEWTQGLPRYALLPVVALAPAAAALPVQRWLSTSRLAAFGTALSIGALLLVVARAYGPPAPSSVRAEIDRRLGDSSDELLATDVTHVVGEYWKVWPIVFHANWMLYEQGASRRLYGVTLRSRPTADLWGPELPCNRVVASRRDDRDFRWHRTVGLLDDRDLELVRTGATLDFHRVVCEAE